MSRLLEFVRSLGPSGAAANARLLLDERRRDERIVQAIARQLAMVDGPNTRAA